MSDLPKETSEEDEKEPAAEEEPEEAVPAEEDVEEVPPEAEEEDFIPVEERVYTVPLGPIRAGRGYRRTPRAVKALRRHVMKHMKTDRVALTKEVNELLWKRGIRMPPRRIRIRAARNEEGEVRVYLA